MANNMTEQEQDVRQELLNSFMSCTHRDTDKIKEVHKKLRDQDPLFYAHLACWYQNKGDLRDIKEVFASMLITDTYVDNREVGLALFREHAPFMKSNILGFIRGKVVNIRTKLGTKTRRGKRMVNDIKNEKKRVGLKQPVPTSFKNDIRKYLRWLEGQPERFDAIAMRSPSDLKTLYVRGAKMKPSERAQQILFKKKYPKDSKMTVYEEFSSASPQKAAKLIVEHKIPYTVAVGLVQKVTPSILVALINAMSPQEVINNVASLQEKGAMDNAKTKVLIEQKLEKAKKTKSVAALKSKTAKATGRVKDAKILKQLDEVADVQVKKSGAITLPTAVFVDRSGSMSTAIEVGKKVAAMISGATTAALRVVAFDTMPAEVVAKGDTLSDWERAFAPVHAGGGTSMGCALHLLLHNKVYVEQIVVISDEEENSHPMFADVYREYQKVMNVTPSVIVINVDDGGDTGSWRVSRDFSNNLKRAGIDFEFYKPAGNDYYGLPGLIPLLSQKSKLDLVYEIMDVPLKTRKAFK